MMPDWHMALKVLVYIVITFLLCGMIYAVVGGKGKDKDSGN